MTFYRFWMNENDSNIRNTMGFENFLPKNQEVFSVLVLLFVLLKKK